MPVKKKIVVVKSLRDVSPKKQLLVSRSLQGNEMAEYEPSSMGNHSPQVCTESSYDFFDSSD